MAFTLVIKFEGLFLFVRDPDGERMHAILPSTKKLGPDHVHRAELVYESKYVKDPTKPAETDLMNRLVDTGGARGTGSLLDIPAEILNVTQIAGRVPQVQLGSTPRSSVAGRFTVPAASIATVPENLPEFEIAGVGSRVPMSHILMWTIKDVSHKDVNNNDVDELHLFFQPLSSTGNAPTSTVLIPVDDKIELHVRHFPVTDVYNPPIDYEAKHFKCHYPVIDPKLNGPVPKLKKKPKNWVEGPGAGAHSQSGEHGAHGTQDHEPGDKGRPKGSMMTCMGAQALPQ